MSYTEHYHDTITVSGHVSVHYPASDTGGTASAYYSETVPINVNIHVDTDAFERSVRGTNSALTGVTTALSAAEAAEVAAIHESARKIARSATKGFFGVLSSELSSRVSEFASSMRSSVGLLMHEAQAVDNVHRQMDSDYHAIKARYTKLFDELDRELDRRIRELDADAFQLSSASMRKVIEEPYEKVAGQVYTQTIDSHNVPLKLQCARTKERVSDALGTMGDLCDYLTEYSASMEQVIDETPGQGAEFFPVLYTIQEDQRTAERRIVVHTGEGPNGDRMRQGVMTYVATRPDRSWTYLSPEDRQALHNEFMRLVSNYAGGAMGSASPEDRNRVCQTMLGLYQQANLQTSYTTQPYGAR